MNKLIRITIGAFLIFFGTCSYEQRPRNQDESKIDSLINVESLNSDCLLVNFGSDAVCAVNTSEGIVVIDGGMSTGLTSRYRKIIEREFSKNNFVFLFNTHGHPDHCGGNSVFSDAKVIAHENFVKDISSLPGEEKRKTALLRVVEQYNEKLKSCPPDGKEWNYNFTGKMVYQSAYKDLKNPQPVKIPDIIFKDSLTIKSGNISFKMFWPGPYHSNSDIIIYIPQMNILFTGDLFFHHGYPGRDESFKPDKLQLKQTIKYLQHRIKGTEKFISGHADILSAGEFRAWVKTLKF